MGDGGPWPLIVLGLVLLVAARPLGRRMARREGDAGGGTYLVSVLGLGLLVSGVFFLLV